MTSSIGATNTGEPRGGIDVGKYHVDMVSTGSGPYTVIFESGFASPLGVWQKVAPEIAKSARTVIYSRAGIGQSDARPEPRLPQRYSVELDQLIEAAQLKPPFILVGHSYGGYLIRLFAARHPDQVAGMVFVDPSMERFDAELNKVDAAKLAQDHRRIDALTPPQFKAESKLLDHALATAGKMPPPKLPDVPAIILTSTMVRPNPEFFMHTQPAVAVWRNLHDQLFRQFSSGSHIVTANSGHNIHLEEPALVIGAIQQVMASATVLAERRAHQIKVDSLMRTFDQAATMLKNQRSAEVEQLVAAALTASGLSERDINSLGYAVLNERRQLAMSTLIMKYNSDTFPESANAHDSYGELLLEMRQPAAAKEQFLQAVALGGKGNNAKALEAFRSNLAKAEKAILAQ
ncbi:alpha/beta fold hydrolase [Duganella sp. FT135W]|uniref:Alpha/beta fold hydrolase n=2 Tax=Duganella flavida TaxID=2692175 RepID=A0A6L8K7X5_9BURK|nr:alpha/beta fold hydrolase [Duganella flavida]